ncbi:MAG: hypothetical protein HKN73_10855, partial [Gemmatimonadetes bacterium]|nr:hypothetical protein [Gemmatimonadota bacterium]
MPGRCFFPCSRLVFFLLTGSLFLAACSEDDGTGPPAGQGVLRLNEFLASNVDGLLDEDGEDSDWIEIHNGGSAPVNLSGWYVTDDANDLTRWAFPAVTVEAGAYLVLFASDKDRRVAGAELHTSFRLSGGGEYLALVQPDGTTVEDEYSPTFPPQTENVSYGYVTPSAVGYLANPTPGAANSGEASVGLQISPEGGAFSGSLPVILSVPGGGATIRYTTDGSEPDATSTEYTGPLSIETTTRLRARTFDGAAGGPEVFAYYTEVTDSVASFQSDLPLVVVHTFGQNIPDDDEGVPAAITFVDRTGGTASPTDDAMYAGGTSIDTRGFTSADFPKKQFKLELRDVTGSDVDADLFGMGAEEDWVLYGPGRFDRNMIANPLMQRLAGRVGLTEMSQRFVELFLSEGSGAVGADDYAGIYIVSENVKIDATRVDIQTLGAGDNTEPEVTGGYILKIDRADPDEYGFKTASGFPTFVNPNTLVVVRPKLPDLTSAQQTWIESHINDFEAALNGPNSTDPVLGYAPYIHIPSWIDAHILRLIAKDTDFLVFSHFLTKDREGKIRTEPLCDFDRTLGSDDDFNANPNEVFHPERADPFEFGWWG